LGICVIIAANNQQQKRMICTDFKANCILQRITNFNFT
jgi:hypothetical protein